MNRHCDNRLNRDKTQESPYLLGKLHTEPLTHCGCGGRVYELLTHRDCGAAILRGYMRGPEGDFLWHEPSGPVVQNPGLSPLAEVQLLVDGDPHAECDGEAAALWLDTVTGSPGPATNSLDAVNFLKVLRSDRTPGGSPGGSSKIAFQRCPICTKKWKKGRSKIMDLVTKGETPFANLVKAQIITQPPKQVRSTAAPNEGRKVLLFSDGRQKAAARLAQVTFRTRWNSTRSARRSCWPLRNSSLCERRPGSPRTCILLSLASSPSTIFSSSMATSSGGCGTTCTNSGTTTEANSMSR